MLVQTSQNRPVEIPECRGLDPIGEHAQEQPIFRLPVSRRSLVATSCRMS